VARESFRLRDLDGSPDSAELLRTFYSRLYLSQFPERDERESLEHMLSSLAATDRSQCGYFVSLLLNASRVVGGVVADYFAASNSGVIEFLVVDPACHGRGLGTALESHVLTRIDVAADSRRNSTLVFAEIEDPRRAGGTAGNTVTRMRFWHHRGYRHVAFPYVQPALSRAQSPVTTLLLAAKPLAGYSPQRISSSTVRAFLTDYLRYAMRIPEPSSSTEFNVMARYLERRVEIPLTPLCGQAGNPE
jgi:GNAT superfamily N-acetyltransferase